MIADGSVLGDAPCFTVLGRAIFQLTPPSSGLAIRVVWAEVAEEAPGLKLGCGWLAIIVIVVAILLWLLGALLRGWYG